MSSYEISGQSALQIRHTGAFHRFHEIRNKGEPFVYKDVCFSLGNWGVGSSQLLLTPLTLSTRSLSNTPPLFLPEMEDKSMEHESFPLVFPGLSVPLPICSDGPFFDLPES